MADYHEVLRVHRRAEPEVIRAAYRILARKYHPDHGGDMMRMIALNDAWDILGDPVRKAAYDATLLADQQTPAVAVTLRSTAQPAPDPYHAGPPPGRPSGTVLNFGRYSGWSLGEIARTDLSYLEWLQRATVGRSLRAEIDASVRQRRGSAYTAPTQGFRGHRWGNATPALSRPDVGPARPSAIPGATPS